MSNYVKKKYNNFSKSINPFKEDFSNTNESEDNNRLAQTFQNINNVKLQKDILGNQPIENETAFESKIKQQLSDKSINKRNSIHFYSGKDVNKFRESLKDLGIFSEEYLTPRKIKKLSQNEYDELKNTIIDINNLTKLFNTLNNVNCNFKSYECNESVGGITPLTYLIENAFSMDSKQIKEMNDKYNILKKYIYNYRAINGDGNCFYRAVMFRYLEILVLNENIEYLQNVIYDIVESFKSEELRERINIRGLNIKPDLTCKVLILIVDLLKNKMKEEAYQILVKSFSTSNKFDYAIILYFRYILYDYIRKNENKAYTKSFPIKLGNLLPSQFETSDGRFLFSDFYQNYLLNFFTDSEKIIIYLTPLVLDIELNIIIFDDYEEDILQKFKCGGNSELKSPDTISLLNRKNHYEIIYSLKDYDKNKNIFANYENNKKSVILSNVDNLIKKNNLNESNFNLLEESFKDIKKDNDFNAKTVIYNKKSVLNNIQNNYNQNAIKNIDNKYIELNYSESNNNNKANSNNNKKTNSDNQNNFANKNIGVTNNNIQNNFDNKYNQEANNNNQNNAENKKINNNQLNPKTYVYNYNNNIKRNNNKISRNIEDINSNNKRNNNNQINNNFDNINNINERNNNNQINNNSDNINERNNNYQINKKSGNGTYRRNKNYQFNNNSGNENSNYEKKNNYQIDKNSANINNNQKNYYHNYQFNKNSGNSNINNNKNNNYNQNIAKNKDFNYDINSNNINLHNYYSNQSNSGRPQIVNQNEIPHKNQNLLKNKNIYYNNNQSNQRHLNENIQQQYSNYNSNVPKYNKDVLNSKTEVHKKYNYPQNNSQRKDLNKVNKNNFNNNNLFFQKQNENKNQNIGLKIPENNSNQSNIASTSNNSNTSLIGLTTPGQIINENICMNCNKEKIDNSNINICKYCFKSKIVDDIYGSYLEIFEQKKSPQMLDGKIEIKLKKNEDFKVFSLFRAIQIYNKYYKDEKLNKDNIINELKKKICRFCEKDINLKNRELYEIPCKCHFCCREHIDYYLSEFDFSNGFVCLCMTNYTKNMLFELGVLCNDLNIKTKEKIRAFLTYRLNNRCCICDNSLYSPQYSNNLVIDIEHNIKNYDKFLSQLLHMFCGVCYKNYIKNNDIYKFKCKICKLNHYNIKNID